MRYDGTTMVVGNGVVLTVRSECTYTNSLDVTARFYDGVPRLPGLMVSKDPRMLESWKLTFQLVGPGRSAWVGPDEKKEHPPESLAEFLLKHFLELQQRGLDRRN